MIIIGFIFKHWLTVIFIVLGLMGGYLYWYYVGCLSGTCAIASSPIGMTLYGGLFGALAGNFFDSLKNRKK